ncbi:Toll-interacting protein [Entamoeba marina]
MRIQLKVVEALNLKGGDFLGLTSNPYCKIITRQTVIETPHISNTRNPIWNKSFTLDVFPDEEILFEVLSFSSFNRITQLGTTQYKIPLHIVTQVVDTWLTLGTGQLHIQVFFQNIPIMPSTPIYNAPPTTYQPMPSPVYLPQPQYIQPTTYPIQPPIYLTQQPISYGQPTLNPQPSPIYQPTTPSNYPTYYPPQGPCPRTTPYGY